MKTQVATSAKAVSRFPISISEGRLEAKICLTPTKMRGVNYDAYTLCWS